MNRLSSLLPVDSKALLAAKLSVIILGILLAPASIAQVQYTVLYNFPTPGGVGPSTALIQAADGNFYGATPLEIFKVAPTGNFSIFYTFCALANCPDGNEPQQNLIQGLDGSFYGVNGSGGANGGGTIFKLTQSGVFSVLHTFCSQTNCTDGTLPEGGVIQDAAGNFYGATNQGGAYGKGTLYEITNSGTFSVLHSFCALTQCYDGASPTGNLVMGSDGNFYGTTLTGGTIVSDGGTVYQWTPSGKFKVIYSFCINFQCSDGDTPLDGLAEGSTGGFYGVTAASGDSDSLVYSVSSTGDQRTLYYFCPQGACLLSAPPTGPLIWGSDGYYYGVTAGAAYSEAVSGPNAPLYIFCSQGSCADGTYPAVGMIQGSDGSFYGGTSAGGSTYSGVIYKLTNGTLAGPVQLNFAEQSVTPGGPAQLTWAVSNAFSTTMQQCVASVASGGGSWSGLQAGTVSGTNYGATATITPTAIGTYTYALTCGGVESGFATLAVTESGKISSATSMTASPNPATIGNPVTLTATVTPSLGKAAPTGTVQFKSGTVELGSGAMNGSGVASITRSTTGLAAGTYPITASYSGDSNYDASTSAVIDLKLEAETTPTATGLSVTPNPVAIGQTAMLTATVSSKTGVPTGSVSFFAEGVLLGSASLSTGVAQFSHSTAGLTAGSYKVTAVYQGSAPWYGSTSTPANVTVSLNPTTVSLSATPNPVIQGNEVTLTAQVARTGSAVIPTGKVTFSSGGVVVGSAPVGSQGTAAIVASSLGIDTGTYPVIATYGGDASDAGSVSSPVSVVIKAP